MVYQKDTKSIYNCIEVKYTKKRKDEIHTTITSDNLTHYDHRVQRG